MYSYNKFKDIIRYTDGDTLDDYTEIYLLGLNPLKVDTDGNGVTDDNEDYDLDGLTNGYELNGVNVI